MPRDGNGTYSLPAGNPVQSGTVIASAWANDTFDDVALALTDSLDRRGRGGMLAPFRFTDGTSASPGAAWSNEPSTGFYRDDPGDLQTTVLSRRLMRWFNDTVFINKTGTDGAPVWEEVLTTGPTNGQVPVNAGTAQGQTLRWDQNTDLAWEASNAIVIGDADEVTIVGDTDITGTVGVTGITTLEELNTVGNVVQEFDGDLTEGLTLKAVTGTTLVYAFDVADAPNAMYITADSFTVAPVFLDPTSFSFSNTGIFTGLFTGTGITQQNSKFEVTTGTPGVDPDTIYFVV